MADYPNDLVPAGHMHNYGDCRDLCTELLEISYDSGAVVLYLDLPTGPAPLPAGTRTLLFAGSSNQIGGSDQEERGYYCDVVVEPGGKKVLISKAALERLVAICRHPEPLAGPIKPQIQNGEEQTPAAQPEISEPLVTGLSSQSTTKPKKRKQWHLNFKSWMRGKEDRIAAMKTDEVTERYIVYCDRQKEKGIFIPIPTSKNRKRIVSQVHKLLGRPNTLNFKDSPEINHTKSLN